MVFQCKEREFQVLLNFPFLLILLMVLIFAFLSWRSLLTSLPIVQLTGGLINFLINQWKNENIFPYVKA